jgi:hypothetical protein
MTPEERAEMESVPFKRRGTPERYSEHDQRRAKKGGEYGANGEWYEGGKFINTVEENRKKEGSHKKGSGKQEIGPYQWEVPPEGKMSLFRKFAGIFGKVVNGKAVLRTDDQLDQTLAYYGTTRQQAQELIDKWNAGERWVDKPAAKPTEQTPAEEPKKRQKDLYAKRRSAFQIRRAVADAARATHRNPTEAQKESGNYPKGKAHIHGLELAIETPRGAIRRGINKATGEPWQIKLPHHYGYIKKTESEADGDHVDVFIGPHPELETVYVIDQMDPISRRFDEAKVMLGFAGPTEANTAYHAAYQTGWPGFLGMTPLPMEHFRKWLTRGDTGSPLSLTRQEAAIWNDSSSA